MLLEQEKYLKKGNNNLNFIRLFLAILVVFAHSFDLGKYPEPLTVFSKGQIGLGSFAVNCFFIISGILITHSYIRSKDNFMYLYKRFIRLFPGLFVCALFTVIIIGSINTTLPLINFFTNKQVYNYLFKNSFLLTSSSLPGVFVTNPYPFAVNGSLWTLRFEVLLYLVVFIIEKKIT